MAEIPCPDSCYFSVSKYATPSSEHDRQNDDCEDRRNPERTNFHIAPSDKQRVGKLFFAGHVTPLTKIERCDRGL